MEWMGLDNLALDPYWNLALEEYLLKEKSQNIFYLWRNKPAVVTGKHQNSWEEVNISFCEQNEIAVARRLSGGGTVYHDLNNLNFTFILNRNDSENLIDFGFCIEPILQALIALGIPAEMSPRKDLFVEGKKVSGNAEHLDLKRKRVIHHGTLLFEANLNLLRQAIRPGRVYESKAVKSVRSPVGNLQDYLHSDMEIENFMDHLNEQLCISLNIQEKLELSSHDHRAIDQLSTEKYRRKDWIYGYSPRFQFKREHAGITSDIRIEKGCYKSIQLKGAERDYTELFQPLIGIAFGEDELMHWLSLQNMTQEEVQLYFELLC